MGDISSNYPFLPDTAGRWGAVLALVAASVLAAVPALAGPNVRCSTDIVGRGATFYEVLERCGEPQFEFGRVDYRYPGYTVQVDEWTYDQGSNRFRRVLHFENGRLRFVELRSKPLNRTWR